VFNALGLFSGGALRRVYKKVYLPTYGAFQEGRWFAAGETVRALPLVPGESRLARAVGTGVSCGLLVCEDLWHPSLAYLLAQDGAQILLASVNGGDKGEGPAADGTAAALFRWELLARTAALAYGVFVAVGNRTGEESGMRFFGSSFVVGPDGNVVARAKPYAEDLLVCDVDFGAVRRARTTMPLFRDERLELTARELARVIEERTSD
jgi:predicted amidohydrolase